MLLKPGKIILILAGVCFLLSRQLYAEDISVSAEVNTNQVALGSSFQLTLTVSGLTNIGEMNLPQFDAFDIRYLGPSTHISVVNGRRYSSKSFTYSVTPKKTGQFIIQPLTITLNGKSYSTQPINIEVLDQSVENDATLASMETSLKEKINLVLRVPKKEVFLNEAIPVKIMLLVNGLSVRDIRFPEISNVGFLIDEYSQPKQYQQVINGMRYDIVEFDTVAYPTRTGELTLGPGKLECNLLVKAGQRQSLGGLFNDDFFNAFFDRAEKKSVTLESEPVTIKVQDLPNEGQPKDFSGAVGHFTFEVSAAPTELKAGDPVTLRMKIKGRGNLKAFEFPEIKHDKKFKVYKPSVKESTNVKSLEQVAIPLSDEVTEIPPLSFSFFDPQLKKYKTITQGPFPLTVSALNEEEAFNVAGITPPASQPLEEEKLGEDIVFIKDRLGSLKPIKRPAFASPIYVINIILLLSLWLGAFFYHQWTHRLATDQVFARKLKAPKEAKKGLRQAYEFMKQGSQSEFYDTLFITLRQYCAHKFQIAPGAVSTETIRQKIKLDQNNHIIGALDKVLKECESVRYASLTISEESMHRSYQSTVQIIDRLERL